MDFKRVSKNLLYAVCLNCQKEFGFLILKFEGHPDFWVVYEHEGVNTRVQRTTYNKLQIQLKEYIDVMCEDLEHIFMNANFAENLSITVRYYEVCRDNVEAADRVYEKFKSCFKKQQKGIPVNTLSLNIDHVSKLRDILQCFDSNTLKDLYITYRKEENQLEIVGFGNIVKMDQWKSAKDINLKDFYVSIPFEHFCHCEDVDIKVWKISAFDIQKLITLDFHSPKFCSFSLNYEHLEADVTEELLDKLIGKKQSEKFGFSVRLIKDKREFLLCKESKEMKIIQPDILYSRQIRKYLKKVLEADQQLSKLSLSQSSTEWLHNILIMGKITEYLNFKDLQVLRKVSREIRELLEILKPDPKVVAVEIFGRGIGDRYVRIFDTDDTEILDYFEKPEYTYQLNKINYSNDMFHIFKNQKTALTDLSLKYIEDRKELINLNENPYVELFKETFPSLNRLLSVEKLNMMTNDPETVVQILQFLDPVSLKAINFAFSDGTPTRDVRSIETLSSMKHWKNASELHIHSLVVKCDVVDLVHFTKFDIVLDSILLEDVVYLKDTFLLQNAVYLKDTFLSSPEFRQFKAEFVNSDINESIFEDDFLGDPFRRIADPSSGLPNIWFFPYTDVEEDLQIRYYEERKKFMFTRIPREARF